MTRFRRQHPSFGVLVGMLGVVWGCGYHHYTGPLRPALEQPNRTRAEAGGVIFAQGHLRVEVRALTDTELNRQFQSRSVAGPQSTNPYTFADTRFWEGDKHRSRFTTFSLRVVNEDFPKVKIDPSRVSLQAVDGSEYWSLELQQLDTYYRAYAVGFRGNEYARYQERLDLLRSTLFKNEEIFAGQEAEGYVVFPALHHDVSEVEVAIHDAVLRFDHRNEPVETVQIHCRFKRDIGKIYRDGRLVLEASS